MTATATTFYLFWRVENGEPALANADFTLWNGNAAITGGYSIDNWVRGGAYSAPDGQGPQPEYGRCQWTFTQPTTVTRIEAHFPLAAPEHFAGYADSNGVIRNLDTHAIAFDAGYVIALARQAGPTPTASAATALTATRQASDPRRVDVSWTGTLINGDEWVVVLGDPNGYPFETELTRTSGNAATVTMPIWSVYPVRVYPASAPTLKISINVPQWIPDLTPPTLLRAEFIDNEGYGTVRLRYRPCDWLALDPPEFTHRFRFTHTATQETTGASDGGMTTILPNGEWEYSAPLDRRQTWTVAAAGQVRYDYDEHLSPFTAELAVSPSAAPEVEPTLTLLTAFKKGVPLLVCTWTYRGNYPVALQLQVQVDGEEWHPLKTTDPTDWPELILHGNECSIDQTGPLDQVTGYRYSDGATHAVTVRCRPVGEPDWRESEPLDTLLHTSGRRPQLAVDAENHRLILSMGMPLDTRNTQVFILLTNGSGQTFGPYLIDSFPHYLTLNQQPLAWIKALPDSLKNGTEYALVVRIVCTDSTGVERLNMALPPQTVTVPSLAHLAPPIPAAQFGVWDPVRRAIRLTYPALIPLANAIGNAKRYTLAHTLFRDGQPATGTVTQTATRQDMEFELHGVGIPDDGNAHTLTVQSTLLDRTVTNTSSQHQDSILIRPPLAAPATPLGINAALRQQRAGDLPAGRQGLLDLVELTWSASGLVELLAAHAGKLYPLGYSNRGREFIENFSHRLPADGHLHPVQFGVRSYRYSVPPSAAIFADAIPLQAPAPPVQTPDEQTGSASTTLSMVALRALLYADLALLFPTLPTAMRNLLIDYATSGLLHDIKQIIATGGTVTLADFGTFAAVWSHARTDPITGTVTPALRGLKFAPSPGFTAGVKAGTVMTDAEAETDAEAKA